jgi:hypothetical protein
MNEEFFTELSAWLTEAGLASTPETAIVGVSHPQELFTLNPMA